MKNKFEIKSHDGPGRLGKCNGEVTPKIFNEKEIKIAPSEGSSYNIDKEIAKWNVEKTLELANNQEYQVATIQGSKYLDLRIECAQKLEELGYNGLIIANGDDLLTHPKDLVDLIINLRKNLDSNTFLIFPFAEPSFMPILSYIGIDGFLENSCDYYSYLNVLMTPTKSYMLDEYPIYEMTQPELKKYNENTLDLVIKEIQTHMKNRSLRNLIEERSCSNPQVFSTLRILDKNYLEYILKHNQLF